MASQIDLDTKPMLGEWLAGDPWFEGLLKGTLDAYREAYKGAYDAAARRFGLGGNEHAGPQVRGAG